MKPYRKYKLRLVNGYRLSEEAVFLADSQRVLGWLHHFLWFHRYPPNLPQFVPQKFKRKETAIVRYLLQLEQSGHIAILGVQKPRYVITPKGCELVRRPPVTALLPGDYKQRERIVRLVRGEPERQAELARLREAFGVSDNESLRMAVEALVRV